MKLFNLLSVLSGNPTRLIITETDVIPSVFTVKNAVFLSRVDST